jgi:hypothetical protein
VIANSALAIRCFKPDSPLVDCMAEAAESLERGKAKKALDSLIKTD